MKHLKKHTVFTITLMIVFAYGSFLTADVLTGDSDNFYSKAVKYACVLLCFFLTLLAGRDGHDERDTLLVRIAFFLTCLADLALGIMGHFITGLLIFMYVHVCHCFRNARGFSWNRREIISAVVLLAFAGAIMAAIAPVLAGSDFLPYALLYSAVLAISLWMALGTLWRLFFTGGTARLIALGMVLFFVCDVCVALFYALGDGGPVLFRGALPFPAVNLTVHHTPRSIIGILVWYFYLPAQLLLALSAFRASFLREVFPLIVRVIESHGVDAVNMDAVAEDANVSK